ncbi:polypeptide N-acetylgalactosaminyltransferase 13 [Trichonephila clavipes]|nr:polypeptide N-acetylgalactosaminyltransferase 13 [Trichonephila clavipes]
MCAEFLFMDDNTRPHHANVVDECLQSQDITRMDWPAYSPNLNPIEHVWDMLGRRIAARQPPPTCQPELRRALLDEWCNIPQDQIDNLILSMPRRLSLRHEDTLNSRLAASPLLRLGEEEERWETPGYPQGFLPLNCGATEQNCSVTCMVAKVKGVRPPKKSP